MTGSDLKLYRFKITLGKLICLWKINKEIYTDFKEKGSWLNILLTSVLETECIKKR